MMLEPKLYYQSFQSEILLLNGSLIVVFSALEESPMRISTESLNLPELFFKPPSIISHLMFLELVENSKKNKLELKDIIFSKIAPTLNQQQLFFVEVLNNLSNKLKDHSMMPL